MARGLFEYIRNTSFVSFLVYWVVSVFVFALLYLLSSLINSGSLSVSNEAVSFSVSGLILCLSTSFLIGTIFGMGRIVYNGLFTALVYIQLAFSIIIILILIDKLLNKYVFPQYHAHSHQDKRINTAALMMSIFRHDIDRIRAELKSRSHHDVNIKEIEAIIDGLYLAFLDIDKIFSAKNIHRHKITDRQHVMILTNMEDSLRKLSEFIDFLEEHKMNWKDKNIEFWINYVLETVERIVIHFDDIKITNPHLMISLENVQDVALNIEKKI